MNPRTQLAPCSCQDTLLTHIQLAVNPNSLISFTELSPDSCSQICTYNQDYTIPGGEPGMPLLNFTQLVLAQLSSFQVSLQGGHSSSWFSIISITCLWQSPGTPLL